MKTKLYPNIEKLVQRLHVLIEKRAAKIREMIVLPQAKLYASKGLPGLKTPSIESFITSFRAEFTVLIKIVALQLEEKNQALIGRLELTALKEAIVAKEETIAHKKTQREIQVHERERLLRESSGVRYRMYHVIATLLGCGEIVWSVAGLLKLGDVLLSAIIVGAIIGLAQVVATRAAVGIIKEEEDSKKQYNYSAAFISSALLISLLLSLLRYWFIHTGTGSGIPLLILNPLTLVGINMLLIGSAALLFFLFAPTKAQAKQVYKLRELDREIKASIHQEKVLKKEALYLEQERQEVYTYRQTLYQQAQTLRTLIYSLFDKEVGEFKSENIMQRTDGVYPECYAHPHLPLEGSGIGDFLAH